VCCVDVDVVQWDFSNARVEWGGLIVDPNTPHALYVRMRSESPGRGTAPTAPRGSLLLTHVRGYT